MKPLSVISRRESLNSGVKDIAAFVPTPGTKKAQNLRRAVEIRPLKENKNNNIDIWTLERLLNASNEKLKVKLERAYREIEQLRRFLNEKCGDEKSRG